MQAVGSLGGGACIANGLTCIHVVASEPDDAVWHPLTVKEELPRLQASSQESNGILGLPQTPSPLPFHYSYLTLFLTTCYSILLCQHHGQSRWPLQCTPHRDTRRTEKCMPLDDTAEASAPKSRGMSHPRRQHRHTGPFLP